MLKNVDNALPLKAPKNIGVFGNDAGDLTNGLYSLSGLGLASGNYEFGVLAAGGGSGTGRLTYVVPPLDAIKRRAEQDDALVQYVLNNTITIASGNLFVSLVNTFEDRSLTAIQTACVPFARGLPCVLEDLGHRRVRSGQPLGRLERHSTRQYSG